MRRGSTITLYHHYSIERIRGDEEMGQKKRE
jgi:hypothetical protein